jgi:hypothetical protein
MSNGHSALNKRTSKLPFGNRVRQEHPNKCRRSRPPKSNLILHGEDQDLPLSIPFVLLSSS